MTATTSDLTALRAALAANPGDLTLHMAYADELHACGLEREAMLYRVQSDPGNDEWRLSYATWLEREASQNRETCPECKGEMRTWVQRDGICDGFWDGCAHCKRTGFVPDRGNQDRGEFIRAQCRIDEIQRSVKDAKWYHDLHSEAREITELNARERELLTQHRREWLPACPLPFCKGGRWVHSGDPNTRPHKCDYCKGTGHVGTCVRGFLESVTVPRMGDVLERGEARADDGTPVEGDWQPTDWAKRLYAQPEWRAGLRRVVAADRVPMQEPAGAWAFVFGVPGHPADLPYEVWKRVHPGGNAHPTAEAANQACWEAFASVLRALCRGEG